MAVNHLMTRPPRQQEHSTPAPSTNSVAVPVFGQERCVVSVRSRPRWAVSASWAPSVPTPASVWAETDAAPAPGPR